MFRKFFSILFIALATCVFALTGCDSISDGLSEGTTADLSIHTSKTTEKSSNSSTEEDLVITDWKGYTITTNEIDYNPKEDTIDQDGYYTSEDDVATYIIEYKTLPDNFITKKDAKAMGWSGGSLENYVEDGCIGGDYFGNYEGLLPTKKGRKYYECDIDTMGASRRGAKRIIYSNDGQIYYTDDHYESFTLIYGSDE